MTILQSDSTEGLVEVHSEALGWAHDERRFKVFISYSRRDSAPYSQRLMDSLEALGLAVRLDTRDLAFGEKWRQQLMDFIREDSGSPVVCGRWGLPA
jgi:hypothetical protein